MYPGDVPPKSGDGTAVAWRRTGSELTRVIRRPGFWLISLVMVLITLPHYQELFEHPTFISDILSALGLERHAFERILYLAPIVWSSLLFGRKGAFVVSAIALACMLPRAIFISPSPSDAVFESIAVFIVGIVMSVTIDSLRKERKRRTQLAALNQTSSALSQSLDLSQVLRGSIDSVIEVMHIDAAMVFLLREKEGVLVLAAYRGISKKLEQEISQFKLGEGFNGRVAQTGEPLYVEDVSKETQTAIGAVVEEGIKSQLIVPLKSKGKVMGTLCIVSHTRRQFPPDEVELVNAIGNQIGVAIENAHLYKQERDFAALLRASEERYRELFENAYDAIWLHDLENNIVAANKSFMRLTGYNLDELEKVKASELIAEESLADVKGMEHLHLKEEPAGRLTELTLIKKDGTEASIQLSTNPVFKDGRLVAFQHIARDITEEKRMKENLRYYLGQVTKAQEEERKRIARELHDETIQDLVVLSRQLDELVTSSKGLSEEDKSLLETLWQQTNNIMNGVRRLSQDLRPPTLDRLGLVPALEWLASNVSHGSGIAIEVKTRGNARRFSAEVELLLFRIVQEALSNVWKHSGATNAEVTVAFDESSTSIAIKDDGRGFDLPLSVGALPSTGKLGLAGIHERVRLLGGNVKINSEPGKGTRISIEVPA